MTAPVPLADTVPAALDTIAGAALAANAAAGCQQPIWLTGSSQTIDGATGEILATLTSAHLPGGVLSVACKTRRASRCEPCSRLYRFDAHQLAAAGLRGGKDVPASVATHPRLWVTLTAPSFGPVHLGPTKGGKLRPCHPRKAGLSCSRWHHAGDPAIGTPIDDSAYDYAGAVLFNALAGRLWSRFTVSLRRALARLAGLTQTEMRRQARVSFGKVAEYQRRGVVHFHAVIRADGPDGPDSRPPAWLTPELLADAVRAAHAATWTETPDAPGLAPRRLAWGRQLDIQPIEAMGDGAMTDTRVAAYVAKYATKAAEDTGALDARLTCRACRGTGVHCPNCDDICRGCAGSGVRPDLDLTAVPAHARRMITTCLRLADTCEELAGLRRWAHMLGFGGHFLTKSRSYSTTFGALREARTSYQATDTRERAGLPETVLVLNHWTYAGQTHTTNPTHATNRTETPPCPSQPC